MVDEFSTAAPSTIRFTKRQRLPSHRLWQHSALSSSASRLTIWWPFPHQLAPVARNVKSKTQKSISFPSLHRKPSSINKYGPHLKFVGWQFVIEIFTDWCQRLFHRRWISSGNLVKFNRVWTIWFLRKKKLLESSTVASLRHQTRKTNISKWETSVSLEVALQHQLLW